MIKMILIIIAAFAASGGFWYRFFYRREKRLIDRLRKLIEQAQSGRIDRTEISEEKYSALENSLKQYLDSSLLSGENQQKQKETIQTLISDIAHQTLTPVSNLKIYGEILSEEKDGNLEESEKQEVIDTILEQTEKLDFLVQSLVKLSWMESGIIALHPERGDIRRLLGQLKQEFRAKAEEKELAFAVSSEELYAVYDLKWTAEAVGNIVDNAVKYTPQGGRIQITAEAYSFFVRIDVSDSGVGIKKEEIPKIFGRFYRSLSAAEEPGVGIGLYLTREIIQAQKGYVKVTSEPGRGSVFSVFLPV